ncbi:hypothetical protein CONPUDRAFT_167391 [Coniophora puteana RWD-64-598 SS2]|uniref:RING-type domain-containing protein n=1 Tax=Coniophora puteana (strain RWD-64-598) TaxID=741705 RepID=A0A5M3MGL0_CONPW|nr:uncharacterized protein CONPUDRAFT_167391 [Coniophora puteana RWD-64-598 SS2]EIW78369.1 hypothetical protein CONPUDRAFT_167391 [Coniophora puteana RWD-64-598 SS2]
MARVNTQDNPVVLNVTPADDNAAVHPKNDKKQDTLFGPNIGVITNTPSWAQPLGKKQQVDNLSPEVIKAWIAKSKQPSQPTTTLQALVNLKRPSLRLVPLNVAPSDDPDSAEPHHHHHHHGLEFEYDCDAPQCRVTVHLVLPSNHPLAGPTDSSGVSRVLVYENIFDGGFDKVLKVDEGAMLELGKYELRPDASHSKAKDDGSANNEGDAEASSAAASNSAQSAGNGGATNNSNGNGNGNDRRSRRFTAFNFRKRHQNRAAVSGPALAVVDAEVQHNAGAGAEGSDNGSEKPDEAASGEDKDSMKDGVRIAIKLAALDGDGFELPSANEQMTYLHVVRFGSTPAPGEEDHRSWVVKVVKREATIGPHTFHLHEIYGLSSQTHSHPSAEPSAPAPAPTAALQQHTYPPTASPAAAAAVTEDEPSSECLLCLSSPREVILLPCRHLVACKECAINMVEFGAGGNIVHSEEPPTGSPAPGGGDAGAAEAGMAGGANAQGGNEGGEAGMGGRHVAPTIPQPNPNPNPRRKRKAKGWFCPVCRQPYTSLLRISTTPTAKEINDEDPHRPSTSSEAGAAPPVIAADPLQQDTNETQQQQGGMFRGLLRTIGGGGGSNSPTPAADPLAAPSGANTTLPPDLERGPEPAAAQAS